MTIKGGVAVIAHHASANPMYGTVALNPGNKRQLPRSANFQSLVK
jgi:hypothetical protein